MEGVKRRSTPQYQESWESYLTIFYSTTVLAHHSLDNFSSLTSLKEASLISRQEGSGVNRNIHWFLSFFETE